MGHAAHEPPHHATASARLYRRVPALQKACARGVYAGRELLVLGFVKNPKLMRVAEEIARRHMRAQIADPELLEKVTPGLHDRLQADPASNRWYPALGKPNVELVDSGDRARCASARSSAADGSEREVDTIIFGTGFQVTDMPVGHWVRGRGGRKLADAWERQPAARTSARRSPASPTCSCCSGRTPGLGHSSMVYMIESQIDHVIDALRVMRRARRRDRRGHAGGAGRVQRARSTRSMEGTVWNTGCASWYIDATGRNATLWPDWTWRFRRRSRRVRPGGVRAAPARRRAEREAVAA